MVMLVVELDLFIGDVIVMTSIVEGEVSNGRNEMIHFAILIALIVGMVIGLFNGSNFLWIILNCLFLVILKRTSYGRRIFAVGRNPKATRLNGLPVNLLKISV